MKEPLITKRKIIQHLKEHHPYPEDVFNSLSSKDFRVIRMAIAEKGYNPDRVFGNVARTGYESAIAKLEDLE